MASVLIPTYILLEDSSSFHQTWAGALAAGVRGLGLQSQYGNRKKRKNRKHYHGRRHVPHGSDFNTLAAAGAFDRGQHARIDCGHCRRLALNVMSLNENLCMLLHIE